jgi:AcrR family transcriptional regulator
VSARPHDRILSTATDLFRKEGIAAVGVNRIIGKADVAPMTLYRQFGSKDGLVAAALEQWGVEWMHFLSEALGGRSEDPWARLEALWDALEAWVTGDGCRGSFITNGATELRSEPDHPAQPVIAAHRRALRQLLEDLAKSAGASDPAVLAAQLQVLIDGAIAAAAIDRDPAVARDARELAKAALGAASAS